MLVFYNIFIFKYNLKKKQSTLVLNAAFTRNGHRLSLILITREQYPRNYCRDTGKHPSTNTPIPVKLVSTKVSIKPRFLPTPSCTLVFRRASSLQLVKSISRIRLAQFNSIPSTNISMCYITPKTYYTYYITPSKCINIYIYM